MITKDGRVESPTVLLWVRAQRCRIAEYILDELRGLPSEAICKGPIDPHHVDGKGMGGARCRDDRVVPLCRKHHDAIHDHGHGWDGRLSVWADETRCRFLDRASKQEVQQYIVDLGRWRERPLAVPF